MCDCHGEAALRGGLAQETPPRAGRPAVGGTGRPLAAVSLAASPDGREPSALPSAAVSPPPAGARPRRAVGLRSAAGGRRRGRRSGEQVSGGSGARRAGHPCRRRGALPIGGSRRAAAGPRARGRAAPEDRGAPPVRARSALVPAPRLCCRQYPLTAFACALSASLLPWRTRVGAERCSGRKRRGCGAAGSSAARCQPESGGTLRGLLRVFFCPLCFALTHLQFSCVSWGGKCNIYIYALLMFVTYWYIINCFLIIGLLNKCGLHPCAS